MRKLINGILDKMKKICKPQRKFIGPALMAILGARGKLNFRNMSRYSIYDEKTFTRNYAKEFNFAEFNQHLLSEAIPKNTCLIAAFDPSFIKKSGAKTYGKDFFWNGSASKAEKGLELGLLAVIDVDHNTGYSISARQTPPIAATRKNKTSPTTKESRVDAYLEHIKEAKQYLPFDIKYLVVDGFFSKKKFVAGVKNIGMELVGKLRIDANMRHLYHGEKNSLGRPRKYDKKVDITDLNQFEFVREVAVDKGSVIKLYTAIVNSPSLGCDIRIVLIVDGTGNGRTLLFSTDLTLAPFDIYRYYKARFQIEFVFRDAKQFTGLDDCQARSKERLHFHFNASFVALNVAKAKDRESWKPGIYQHTFSMASWKARFCNENLIEKIFSMLGPELTSIKYASGFEALRNYGTISNFI